MFERINMDRLALSRQVIDTWEAMGGPSGTEGNLRLVHNEIEILVAFSRDHPERGEESRALIERYTNLSRAIRSSLI